LAKRLELFNGAMPTPAIATLANPKNPNAEAKAQKPSPQANLLRVTQLGKFSETRLPKSSKGAEPAPPSCTLNHRTTEPQYHRNGHLPGRWLLMFHLQG
jgi:hypothetical protein